jgi:hypothetical protein
MHCDVLVDELSDIDVLYTIEAVPAYRNGAQQQDR